MICRCAQPWYNISLIGQFPSLSVTFKSFSDMSISTVILYVIIRNTVPLTWLLKSNAPFSWSDFADSAIGCLMTHSTSETILQHFDPSVLLSYYCVWSWCNIHFSPLEITSPSAQYHISHWNNTWDHQQDKWIYSISAIRYSYNNVLYLISTILHLKQTIPS